MKTTILDLRYSPYENGKVSGEYFRNKVDTNEIENYANKEIVTQCTSVLELLKQDYPRYYEEVKGKADGLCMDVVEYFTVLCPELSKIHKEQCTTVVRKKDNGHYVLSHNEDDVFVDNNFCLSKVWIDNTHWFMTNDMFNMPFGNGVSWNSYGMVKTINYCHDENYNVEQLPRYFAQRHISEAKSIEDLINRCKEMKVASGYHVIGIDTNTLEAVSIEVHSDGVDVESIENYAHSNHFIHHNCEVKCDEGSNSVFRLEKARELLESVECTKSGLKSVVDYHGENNDVSIFQDNSTKNITIFNMTIDTESSIDFTNYVDGEELNFEYK